MIYKIFLDSDVVLDYFTNRDPYVNAASELFELNLKGEIVLYLSAVSINNIYYITRKFLGHKKSIEAVETLVEMTEIVGTSKNELIHALKSGFSDFEDSIQYASALTIEGIDLIITRNIKDYRHSDLAVMTPDSFLKMLNR